MADYDDFDGLDPHDLPDHDDLLDRYEIVTTLRPRRQSAHARPSIGLEATLTATPAHRTPRPHPTAAPPRPPLPTPATPYPDLIPAIMPHGSICTLSGASGVGKTAFLASLIKAFQLAAPLSALLGPGLKGHDHPTRTPAAIGILVLDRPWRDHKQWFDKAGCDPFPYYALRDDPTFDYEVFRDWRQAGKVFAGCVDKLALPPDGLLIVDPLPLFIPGRLIDYKDVAIGMAALDKVLLARQLTMLGVFHVAKQKANKNDQYLRPQDRILGSGGQVGYSETAMYLMSPEESGKPYYEFGWVPHQRRAESFALRRDDQGLFQPCDPLDQVPAATVDLDKALEVVPLTPTPAGTIVAAICAALNCKDRSAKTHLAALVAQGRVHKPAHGQYQRVAGPS